jgi:uncharacterized protein (TIGR03435 family)
VYVLTVARGGHKLRESKAGGCVTSIDPDKPLPATRAGRTQRLCGNNWLLRERTGIVWSAFSIDMDKDRRIRSGSLTGRKVVNKTGVTGLFDIDVEVPRPSPLAGADLAPPDAGRLHRSSRTARTRTGTGQGTARVLRASTRSPGRRRTEMAKLPFCLCGVRGGDLMQRIESIMAGRRRAE